MSKDPFDGMSHEAMLEWLDQANSGSVQAAADRLAAAAKEIHSIAEDLKVRPQWVEWKGKGAEAFRTWAGDLANATLTLGDFSQDSSKWLGEASKAIGTAQASIPRDKASAQANLDAARSAHNDPDAGAIASKSASELQAIAANKEKVRQEAATEMRKLGHAYSLSSTQMNGLTRPKFPPAPDAVVPDSRGRDHSSQGESDGGVAGKAMPGTGVAEATGRTVTSDVSTRHRADVAQGRAVPSIDERPTHLGIDSVGTLPDVKQPPVPTTGSGPVGPGPTGPGVTPPSIGMVPPVFGGAGRNSVTARGAGPSITARGTSPTGRAVGAPRTGIPSAEGATGRPTTPGTRGPLMPGQSATGRAGSGQPGRLPTNGGVSGGRPQPVTGKPATGIPRGTVMGGEGAAGARGSSAQGTTGARPAPTPGTTGSRGGASGRRVTGATGENGGIVGGRPQQQGRANTRSFSSGGSGLVRGQSAVSAPQEGADGARRAGRGGAVPHGAQPQGRQDEERGGRPDYLVENEATWQSDDQGNMPPVIDDAPKNSER